MVKVGKKASFRAGYRVKKGIDFPDLGGWGSSRGTSTFLKCVKCSNLSRNAKETFLRGGQRPVRPISS